MRSELVVLLGIAFFGSAAITYQCRAISKKRKTLNDLILELNTATLEMKNNIEAFNYATTNFIDRMNDGTYAETDYRDDLMTDMAFFKMASKLD